MAYEALLIGVVLVVALFYFWRKREKKADVKERWFHEKEIAKKPHEGAPISGACAFCGTKTHLPYKCKYCGKLHCEEHMMPEDHDCTGLKGLRRERRQ